MYHYDKLQKTLLREKDGFQMLHEKKILLLTKYSQLRYQMFVSTSI